MPIRRHGNGWEVRLQHGGRRISRTVATFKDAQTLEAKLRQRVNDHRAGRVPRYTIEEAIARWLTGEAKVLRSYDSLIRKVRTLLPHIEGRYLDELADVAESVRTTGIRQGSQPATINRKLAILRRVGRLAFRQWGWLEQDYAARVKLLPGETARTVQITQDEAKRLMLACEPRTRQAVLWAALTGLRQGELRRVVPSDFHGRTLVVTATKTSRTRAIPLADALDPARFPYGLTEREVAQAFRDARKAAGMEHVQFRDLRRTFGSWVAQRTGNLQAVQNLLGHTTPVITARHYAHLLHRNLREAVDTLPDLAGKPRGWQNRKKHG